MPGYSKTMKNKTILLFICCLVFLPCLAKGLEVNQDSDSDGLSDSDEISIYHTNPAKFDTDTDGYSDGEEIRFGFDPNKKGDDRLEKYIQVSLKDQSLTYSLGPYVIKSFKISSGDSKHPTPPGEYSIIVKKTFG